MLYHITRTRYIHVSPTPPSPPLNSYPSDWFFGFSGMIQVILKYILALACGMRKYNDAPAGKDDKKDAKNDKGNQMKKKGSAGGKGDPDLEAQQAANAVQVVPDRTQSINLDEPEVRVNNPSLGRMSSSSVEAETGSQHTRGSSASMHGIVPPEPQQPQPQQSPYSFTANVPQQQQPQPQQPQQLQPPSFTVTVPHGAVPGSVLQAPSPDGQLVQFVVPHVAPGTVISVPFSPLGY